MDDNILQLKNMYRKKSKHSNYQILPKRLRRKIGTIDVNVKNNYEYERLEYILNKVDVKSKRILDIGGNTGFFTFEAIDNGASFVHYYEGNKTHAEFVRLASEVLDVRNKIKITDKYFPFDRKDKFEEDKYDIMFLLNVLHHIGDDYGNDKISEYMAKKVIISQLNGLSEITNILIFQLGFNWKGNRNICLFENGTKKELIDYILNGTKDNWKVTEIGIPELLQDEIKYCDLNNSNMERDDKLGEFLNRPIFIMESKRYL
jgi:SAM-dependent methyltransferase